jgi:ComF family protein
VTHADANGLPGDAGEARTASALDAHWRRGWAERALDWLYPEVCRHCDAALSFGPDRLLCPSCRDAIRALGPEKACRRCAAPLGPHVAPGADCPDCRSRDHRFTRAVAAARYESSLRSLVHALKFAGIRRAAGPLGALLADRVRREEWAPALEGVVPVPLFTHRERERGFNQSSLLAAEVAARLGLPLSEGLIRRSRHTHPQALLGQEERLRNQREAFAPVVEAAGVRACLLVDDVMTTGATVDACAVALRAAGVERIYVATVGR